ncbi:MAG TPA: tetraacyldisaccharide 4'-kinase, partial [Nitrospiria bacterium]
MGLIVYNLIIIVSLPLAVPVFLFLLLLRPSWRDRLPERFGFITDDRIRKISEDPRIWIHAASVGEVQAVAPFIDRMTHEHSRWKVFISVMTRTGRKAAEDRFDKRYPVFYFPADLPGVSRRALKRINPDLIVLAETELWPNFLRTASDRKVPVCLVNGRISDRSFPRYRRFRWIFGDRLKGVGFFGMQTSGDAERITVIGAPPERVRVTGNMKYDRPTGRLNEGERSDFLDGLGWSDRQILFFGSTHEGEEKLALDVFETLSSEIKNLAVVIAPRHPERFPDAIHLLDNRGIPYVRYSEWKAGRAKKGFSVLLLDEMGHLGKLYRLGHAAFVGGTMVPVGGHNLIEPASSGVPVFFGPHYENAREAGDLLVQAGGGRMVRHAAELEEALRAIFIEPSAAKAMGEKARGALKLHQGASRRLLERVERIVFGIEGRKALRMDFRSMPERWFSERLLKSSGDVRTLAAALFLRPLSAIYSGLQRVRAWSFKTGIRQSAAPGRPVISVGNLVLGGSGKTPAVIWLAERLLAEGKKPAVLSRGYGRRAASPLAGSVGGDSALNPEEFGDEPAMMAARMPAVPVVVCADRLAAANYAEKHAHPDVFILDDGFQHLRVRRSLNILILDSINPFGNGRVFPAGSLREPVSAMKRADAVILSRTEDPEDVRELRRWISDRYPNIPVFSARYRPAALVSLASGETEKLESLRGEKIMAVLGIGNPDRF